MTKDTGGPAFPHEFRFGDGTANRADGMTLRDWFATHASQEDIYRHKYDAVTYATCSHEEARYRYADAMLEARK